MSKERELLERVWASEKWDMPEDLQIEIKELLAQPEPEQKPVAYMYDWNVIQDDEFGHTSHNVFTTVYPVSKMNIRAVTNITPLYTSPPKREPLSGKDIAHGFRCSNEATHADSFWAGVEYAEKAHGIGIE